MKTYGLIGYPLGHSFSKKFFTEKFEKEGLVDCRYLNFEIESIDLFPSIFEKNPDICGLNCTIPYKQQVIPFLDEIDEETQAVGAVNTIKIIRTANGVKLKGFNTDIIGFERSLKPMLSEKHKKALILGTGGASKAIKHILTKLNIDYLSASIEEPLNESEIRYYQIDKAMIGERLVIINATPLGTFPKVDNCPSIPYEYLSCDHVLFDLVYNPEITLFMKRGLEKGARVKNGLEMLHGQALASWEIWNR
ncbi:MAG TPA: shikimate dehydrogenase [Prolixibacteraceae bacterium]|nr:shikimate dehydrogenase [Prolixibacteraceae bacterium]HPS12463.1 shikimate dehydrogenase [Prolixibacteraceae bacterium]